MARAGAGTRRAPPVLRTLEESNRTLTATGRSRPEPRVPIRANGGTDDRARAGRIPRAHRAPHRSRPTRPERHRAGRRGPVRRRRRGRDGRVAVAGAVDLRRVPGSGRIGSIRTRLPRTAITAPAASAGFGGPGFGRGGFGFGGITITAISGSNLSLKTEDGWTRTIAVESDTTITGRHDDRARVTSRSATRSASARSARTTARSRSRRSTSSCRASRAP